MFLKVLLFRFHKEAGIHQCRQLRVGKVHNSQNKRRLVPFSIGKDGVLQDRMFWISLFCASNFGTVPTFQLARLSQ